MVGRAGQGLRRRPIERVGVRDGTWCRGGQVPSSRSNSGVDLGAPWPSVASARGAIIRQPSMDGRAIIRGRPPVAQWIRATDFGVDQRQRHGDVRARTRESAQLSAVSAESPCPRPTSVHVTAYRERGPGSTRWPGARCPLRGMSTSCLERSAGALLLIRSWLEQPQRCSRSLDDGIKGRTDLPPTQCGRQADRPYRGADGAHEA
jgi:hypothetical protein